MLFHAGALMGLNELGKTTSAHIAANVVDGAVVPCRYTRLFSASRDEARRSLARPRRVVKQPSETDKMC
jgi:hypothetical protein